MTIRGEHRQRTGGLGDPRLLLRTLTAAAVVRIHAPGGGYAPGGTGGPAAPAVPGHTWGSGFFVAPGWVLTCAHVLMLQEGGVPVWMGDTAIGLTSPAGTFTGELACTLPAHDGPRIRDAVATGLINAHPDLALIRVAGADDHACVWLSDRPLPTEGKVAYFGCSDATGAVEQWTGTLDVMGSAGGAVRLGHDRILPGISGGPVVDLARGAVIGVVKAAHLDGGGGGIAVPVAELRGLTAERPTRAASPNGSAPAAPEETDLYHRLWRAHDRHHLDLHLDTGSHQPTWTDVQGLLADATGGTLRSDQRTTMCGLLSALPPPDGPATVLRLVETVLDGCWIDQGPQPRGWRDGAGMLYDPPETSEVYAFLRYCSLVADAVAGAAPAAAAELAEWVETTARALPRLARRRLARAGAGAGRPTRARASVLVDIEEDHWEEGRYRWTVSLLYTGGGQATIRQDTAGTTRERLRDELREPLAEALRRCDIDQHLASVEVALPRDLFDEPVDEWELVPGGARRGGRTDPQALPIGMRRPVAVRDRFRLGQPTPEWRARWQGVSQGPLRLVRMTEGPTASWNDVYDRMSNAHPASVPVLCGPAGSGPGQEAMDAALAAGHGVALWRRCPAAGEEGECERFHQELRAALDGTGQGDALLFRVRSLRVRNDGGDPGARWSTGIALLHDDPDRPAPDSGAPLEPP
jgi:vWA-MoxR associated protein C-terminal domain/Trypsin-like peptidase domain